jgi:glycyl-tRNA synthetase (class II)
LYQWSIHDLHKFVAGQHITPGVIEPSFGIGRILYAVLEHAYWIRPGDDAQRAVSSDFLY